MKKTVLITGASGGIGSEVLKILLEGDYKIIIIDKDKNTILESLKDKDIYYYQCNMFDLEDTFSIVEKISKDHPIIDILINNAGIGYYEKIENLSYEKYFNSLNLNVNSPHILIKSLLPNLKKSKNPLVLNMGSKCGHTTFKDRSTYCLTKFALRGLSLSLSKEYKGIVDFVYLALGSTFTEFGALGKKGKVTLKESGKEYLDPTFVATYIVKNIILVASREAEYILKSPNESFK